MIIELHAIQTFAPSNLNRDDTGNPKDALFGGVRRARFSSQSAKRAIRVSPEFKAGLGTIAIGIRSKIIKAEIVGRLVGNGMDETQAWTLTDALIEKLFAKPDGKDKKKTNVLIFVSHDEFEWIANQLAQPQVDIEKLSKEFEKATKGRSSAPDIALFGRMLAEKPNLNIDAACQVAHALSTHEVTTAEFDYFTAVDDLLPKEETGAGMLGLVPFNSATYYRCVRIDWEQLLTNLGGDFATAQQTVQAFMQAFALVVPSGMQNTFVNKHVPDFLMAVVRPNNDGQSLMNAFEKPIRAKGGQGYAEPSVKALASYWEQVESVFRLEQPIVAVLNPRQYELPSAELQSATQTKLTDWTHTIISTLPNGGA